MLSDEMSLLKLIKGIKHMAMKIETIYNESENKSTMYDTSFNKLEMKIQQEC